MKLLKKKYLNYSGKVYDIKVSTSDHSYIINNAVVHNSAAGSLTAFCLDITKVDPLEYGLLFERFLNRGRMGYKTFVEINGDIELDFDKPITILREGNQLTVKAHELQPGDTIISYL